MAVDDVTVVVVEVKSDQRVAPSGAQRQKQWKLSTSRAIPLQKIMTGPHHVLVASLDTSKLDRCPHEPVVTGEVTLFFAPYLHLWCRLHFGQYIYIYIAYTNS